MSTRIWGAQPVFECRALLPSRSDISIGMLLRLHKPPSDARFQMQDVSSFPTIHQMVPSYQKLGFRLWNSTLFFHPADQLQNQMPARATVTGKEADKNTSQGGSAEGRGGRRYSVFIFRSMGLKPKCPFCDGESHVWMCGIECHGEISQGGEHREFSSPEAWVVKVLGVALVVFLGRPLSAAECSENSQLSHKESLCWRDLLVEQLGFRGLSSSLPGLLSVLGMGR